MPKRIWLNGKLVAPEQATVSVFDHGLLYGDGVFEGIRGYNGRILKLRTHLGRLYESAAAIRLTIPYTIDELEQAVRETVAVNERRDCYVRLCVTRGEGTLGLNPFTCKHPAVFIIADSITLYPQELYDNGMEIITASTLRNHPLALSPRIKSMNYLNNILAKIEALDAGVMEAVMFNHQGNVAECTGDNLFLVRERDGEPTLHTPPLHAGVLEGVTMRLVEGLARAAGLRVERVDLTRYDLYTAKEMFLTGTAAEVIPVTKVDGRTLGDGKPGGITNRLITAYHELVQHDAPED
ncbi:MAG: branched-chain-amino-acid transaminase [Phycisphaeraceae bacterium]